MNESSSFTLELHATPQEVMRGVERLRDFCSAHAVPPKATHGLALALEETASNIINHAYLGDPQHCFHIAASHAGDRVTVELRDRGPEFDPSSSAHDGKEDEDTEGGWGVTLVRHYMDELRYSRDGAENVLQMTKLLGLP